ncbi:hypothetical protein P2G88_06130 [Aliiglaciecola sp. CAU 1673]|uniref:hypothetical protein n=1 Tax=Aliiglaciecola sp. CAU 1673 TaxID=3032595 RepID=UPI0023DB51D4|nr:hypothetical protein [Aliiglaciecola sp. CAU 1673]MDF2177823.1 hypothetical protein [Aliiglaciecola sp. CAU 1673]
MLNPIKPFLLLSTLLLLCGCQSIGVEGQDTAQGTEEKVSAYYLSAHLFNDVELREEVALQQRLLVLSDDARWRLAILHSRPNSPVYDVKTALNHLTVALERPALAKAGLLWSLHDQLTSLADMQQQLANTKQQLSREQKKAQSAISAYGNLLNEKNALEQQLQQIKAIEQSILNRTMTGNEQ